jgi:tetratricopeptide (TPR) repeat protein
VAVKPPGVEVFIGRDDAIKRLKISFEKLIGEGRRQVVLVAGEAGIGKTTVVSRFLDSLSPSPESRQSSSRPPFCVLQAKCSDITTSGNPYAPFAELLDGLSDTGSKGFRKVLQDWAQDLGPKLLEGVVPYLGPLLARILERQLPKRDQETQFDVITASGHMYQFLQLLEQVSELSPLILFIDDLHWADEASINLIFALARRIAEMPILLIGTYRPHDIRQRPGYPAHPLSRVLLEMRRYHLCEEVLLDQFTLNEVETFLDRHYPDNRFSSSLAETLYEETSGNPFFLDQVVQLLADEGNIYSDANNRWTAKPLDTVPIPNGVLAVVQARMANLDDAACDLLRYASVMGEQFRSRILAEILGQSHLSVLRSLRTLGNEHNLVKQRTGARNSNLLPNWEFSHAFVRKSLYDSLAGDEQAELHSLVVDTLKAQFPGARDDLAGELAHHCEAAKRYEEAIPYRFVATLRAHRAHSYSEQVVHCTQGISDVERSGPSQAKLRNAIVFRSELALAYRIGMDLDRAEDVAQELLRIARQHHDIVAEIEGSLALLDLAVLRRNGEAALQYSALAWSAARRSNAKHHLSRLADRYYSLRLTDLSSVYMILMKQLRQYLDEIIDVCRREEASDPLSRALLSRGLIAFLENQDDQALSLFNEAIEVAKSIKHSDERFAVDYPFAHQYSTIVTDSMEYRGCIYRQRGDWHRAIREFEHVYERKQAERNIPGMAGLLNIIAETQLQAGALEDAERSFEQSWAITRQIDSPNLRAMVLSAGISIALALEDDAKAETRLQLFEEVIQDGSVRWTWHKRQMTRGTLSMRAGAFDEATEFFTIGLKAAEEEHNLDLIAQYDYRLAELNWQCSNLDQALRHANAVLETASSEQVATACIEFIGNIHRRRSEWNEAIKEFRRVYERKEIEKNLPGMAGLLNVVAETQLQAGATEDAEKSFEQSWAIVQNTDLSELKVMILSTGISIALELENDTNVAKRLKLFEELTHDWDARWIWHKRHMTRGILRMWAGATEQAASLLAVGLKAAEDDYNLGLITQYSIHLAELNLQCGSLDQALRHADTALRTAREHNLWELGEACLLSAHARMQVGQKKDEAEELVGQAIEYFQSKNLPHKVALAQSIGRKIDENKY